MRAVPSASGTRLTDGGSTVAQGAVSPSTANVYRSTTSPVLRTVTVVSTPAPGSTASWCSATCTVTPTWLGPTWRGPLAPQPGPWVGATGTASVGCTSPDHSRKAPQARFSQNVAPFGFRWPHSLQMIMATPRDRALTERSLDPPCD